MKRLFTIISLFLLIACNKNSVEPNVIFPISLFFKNVTEKTKIRLFVYKKEITDAVEISNYTERNPLPSLNDDGFKNMKITFINQDTLSFLTDFTKFYYKNDNGLLTITTPYIVKLKESDFENFVMLFPYQKTSINSPSNYDFSASEFIIARGDYDSLSLSYLTVMLKSKNSNVGLRSFVGLYNEFNEKAISKLAVTDTLMVQEFKVNFKSK